MNGPGNPFCANPPLFVLNNVKLLGLLAVLALAVLEYLPGSS